MWTPRVADPFRTDPRFWGALAAAADALLLLVIVAGVLACVGPVALPALAAPAALLAVSAARARPATRAARTAFATRAEWRDAERTAVAAALPGAFVRRRGFRLPGR